MAKWYIKEKNFKYMTQEEWNAKRTLCQVMTRVCGWLVPKHAGNLGKQSEYKDRKEYIIK